METKWEGSVTILSLVAKLSKKVIPPPPRKKKTNFADRLICETVVLKNKKKSTFVRYQSVVKTKFSLLSFYYYKNIIYVCFLWKKIVLLVKKIYFYATILVKVIARFVVIFGINATGIFQNCYK